MPTQNCPNLRQTYNLLVQKQKELDDAISEAIPSGDYANVQIIKKEILEEGGRKEAFHILFLEQDPTIPEEGKSQETGKEGNKRKKIEAKKSPDAYLDLFQESKGTPYEGESGLTPEQELTHYILHLERANEVLEIIRGTLGKSII